MQTSVGKTVAITTTGLYKSFVDSDALRREVIGLRMAEQLGVRVPSVLRVGKSGVWMTHIKNVESAFVFANDPTKRKVLQGQIANMLLYQAEMFVQFVTDETVGQAKHALITRVLKYFNYVVSHPTYRSSHVKHLLQGAMWDFMQLVLGAPTDSFTLVHQDLHFDNVLVDTSTGAISLIDYERSIIGLPEMELLPALFWKDEYSLDVDVMRRRLADSLSMGYALDIEHMCMIFYCLEQMCHALQNNDVKKAKTIFARFVDLRS